MVFRYKITVEGTGILEYYEFEQKMSEEAAAQAWLNDVEAKWGKVMTAGLEDHVNAELLNTIDDEQLE